MKRWLFLAYGVAGYATFMAMYAYMAGFVGNFLVPKSIDAPASSRTAEPVTINLLLVALFAVQHSGMARPGFKRVWTRGPATYRARHVCLASKRCDHSADVAMAADRYYRLGRPTAGYSRNAMVLVRRRLAGRAAG